MALYNAQVLKTQSLSFTALNDDGIAADKFFAVPLNSYLEELQLVTSNIQFLLLIN